MRSIQECLGSNIRTFRKKLGITQAELAERTDLSIWTIQQLEGGHIWLGLETVAALTRALGIDEAWLFQDPDAVRRAAASIADHPIEECLKRVSEAALRGSYSEQAIREYVDAETAAREPERPLERKK